MFKNTIKRTSEKNKRTGTLSQGKKKLEKFQNYFLGWFFETGNFWVCHRDLLLNKLINILILVQVNSSLAVLLWFQEQTRVAEGAFCFLLIGTFINNGIYLLLFKIGTESIKPIKLCQSTLLFLHLYGLLLEPAFYSHHFK